jgi:hypothetical protein
MEERQHLAVILTVFSLTCITLYATMPSDPLWLKAVKAFEKNSNCVPGKIVSHFELINNKGEAESDRYHQKVISWRIYLLELLATTADQLTSHKNIAPIKESLFSNHD